MTLVIDNRAVESVLEPARVVDVLDDATRELGSGGAANAQPYRLLTPREASGYDAPAGTDVAHHSYTSLTGAIRKLNVVCDRIDSDIICYQRDGNGYRRVRVPGTRQGLSCGLIFLYSSLTGEPLAIIHDGYLQKYRVAGTGAVGSRYLARHDAGVMGLIGTGWQAEAAVMCQPTVRRLDEIRVFSPTPGRKEAFAERWAEKTGVAIRPVRTAAEAVRGADIVYTATNSTQPVVAAEWLEHGQLVTGVTDLEVELHGWERCDLLAVNRHGARWERYAIHGAEAVPEQGMEYLKRKTSIDWNELPLIGDIALGKVAGRTSDDQLTGFILRGDGVQFAAVSAYVYEECRRRGLGTEISTELFLQDRKYHT